MSNIATPYEHDEPSTTEEDGTLITDENLEVETRQGQTEHILKGMKPQEKGFDLAHSLLACQQFLVTEIAPYPCQQAPGTRKSITKCKCLTFLASDDYMTEVKGVANYMIYWAGKKGIEKKMFIREWVRLSTCLNTKRNYMLPMMFTGNDNNDENQNATAPPNLICRNALQRILKIGRKTWEAAVSPNGIKSHKFVGRKGTEANRGKKQEEINKSLQEFFESLKEVAVPFATRMIREETGMRTRDDNPDEVALPPHLSKHRCYANWCWQRGWKVVKSSKSLTIYNNVAEYQKRLHDDNSEIPLWPTGMESMPVCSWTTFWNFWRENYSNIKVRARGADTCTDCLQLLHGLNFVPTLPGAEASEDAVERAVQDNISRVARKRKEAERHVLQYQTQRRYANQWINFARMDITNKLPSLFRRQALTIDMGQNIGLPNFAGNQPGDTYYMTPINLYLFGVVDNARENGHDHLNAYIWHEKDGRRGANNIASCLLKDYGVRGFLSRPNFGCLTLIADNCGGQNKNEDVLRFHVWLVEAGIFPCVRIVFLVKGHTKNACDRMFNLLKLDYHTCDIFTYDDMVQKLDNNEHVDVRSLDSNDFYDFQSVLNRYYRSLKTGETNRTHVFTIYSNKNGRLPTVLYKQDDCDSTERMDCLLPTRRNKKAKYMSKEERAPRIQNMLSELEQLEPPGMPPMKEVELFTKWRPILPPAVCDITCPRPSDEVIAKVKAERNKKRQLKQEKQSDEPDSLTVSLKLGI